MSRSSRLFAMAAVAVAACGVAGAEARAGVISYVAALSGSNEVPPNATPGTGSALVEIDDVARTMRVSISFQGLLGTSTAAHIHGPAAPDENAGVITTTPTFPGFPLGVSSGSYLHTFDLTDAATYNPAFVAANGGTADAAAAVFLAYLADGKTYMNVHTSLFPAGELRGNLRAAIPEPASLGLMALGGLGVGVAAARARRLPATPPAPISGR